MNDSKKCHKNTVAFWKDAPNKCEISLHTSQQLDSHWPQRAPRHPNRWESRFTSQTQKRHENLWRIFTFHSKFQETLSQNAKIVKIYTCPSDLEVLAMCKSDTICRGALSLRNAWVEHATKHGRHGSSRQGHTSVPPPATHASLGIYFGHRCFLLHTAIARASHRQQDLVSSVLQRKHQQEALRFYNSTVNFKQTRIM